MKKSRTKAMGLLIYVIVIPLFGLAFFFLFGHHNFPLFIIFSALAASTPAIVLFICRPKCSNCGKPVVRWWESLTYRRDENICPDCKKSVSSNKES